MKDYCGPDPALQPNAAYRAEHEAVIEITHIINRVMQKHPEATAEQITSSLAANMMLASFEPPDKWVLDFIQLFVMKWKLMLDRRKH